MVGADERRIRGLGTQIGGAVAIAKESIMSNAKRVTGTVLLTLSLMGSSVSMASAAPRDKCANNPENFQIVQGKCVSDGRAERL